MRGRNRIVAGEGFTLIELLVVIAIIAILAAILMPVFLAAKESSHKTKCMSNEKQIVAALLLFAEDHNDRLPCAYFNNHEKAFGPGTPNQWKATIRKYLKTPKVFICPRDPDIKHKDVWYQDDFNSFMQYDQPASYRLNNTLVGGSEDKDTLDWPLKPYKLGSVPRTSKLILICESQPYGNGPYPPVIPEGKSASEWEWNQVAAYVRIPEQTHAQVSHTMQNSSACPVPFNRHSGGANYGFADGHVQWMKWKDTWKPSGLTEGRNHWNGYGTTAR